MFPTEPERSSDAQQQIARWHPATGPQATSSPGNDNGPDRQAGIFTTRLPHAAVPHIMLTPVRYKRFALEIALERCQWRSDWSSPEPLASALRGLSLLARQRKGIATNARH